MGYLGIEENNYFDIGPSLFMNHWKMAMRKCQVHLAAHLNGPDVVFCWILVVMYICSPFIYIYTYIWPISLQWLAVPPVYLRLTYPHYSCTYWFVKQPIKLDMEVGMTFYDSVIFPRWLFLFTTSEKGWFIRFFFLKQEPVDTCVTSEKKMWLCSRLKQCLCLWLSVCIVF